MARIGIACGGTGGHLYPGLAVAEELKAMGHEVRLYTSSKEIDRVVMEGYGEFENVALPAVGWTGFNLRSLGFIKGFFRAYSMCKREVRSWQPKAVLGMGGFTCLPIFVAARMRGIPTLLHESNAIPGKATRWLSPWSDKVLLGFGECAAYLDGPVAITGTPVRKSLRRMTREEAAGHWGLDPRRFTLAVMGGSQGARGLNETVARSASSWKDLSDRLQIIHLTGKGQADLMAANYLRAGIPHVVREFCHEMEFVYNLADFVVARSGAASLTEIGHFGLPSILIPYPFAAEKHQNRNADVFSKQDAAYTIEEGEGADTAVAERIRSFIEDESLRKRMAAAAASLRLENPALKVASEVEHALR